MFTKGFVSILQKPCHRLRVERRGRERRESDTDFSSRPTIPTMSKDEVLWRFYSTLLSSRSIVTDNDHATCLVISDIAVSVEPLRGSAISPVFRSGGGRISREGTSRLPSSIPASDVGAVLCYLYIAATMIRVSL